MRGLRSEGERNRGEIVLRRIHRHHTSQGFFHGFAMFSDGL